MKPDGETIALIVNSVLVGLILFYQFIYPKIRRKERYDRRRNNYRRESLPGNPNDKPGKAEQCLKHIERISKIQTQTIEIRRDLDKMEKKNDISHDLIFKKIDELKDSARRI